MGDEVDAFDLPLHEQSGLLDRGTIDRTNEQELQDQAGALNNVLEDYYSGRTNFGNVLPEIENLGYSTERARSIRRSAQVERTIRLQVGGASVQQHNPGTPSDLTPNQLLAIDRSNLPINQRFHVYTSDDGRQFVYDPRVRDVDGGPSRFFLPAPEQFNPLTLAQQDEQRQRLEEAAPAFLQSFEPLNIPEQTGPGRVQNDDFSYSSRTLLDQLSQDYISNPNEQTFSDLRYNVDLFFSQEASQVVDGDDKLNQYLIDIQFEADYRQQNEGRPQLLSQEQYDFLKTHPDYQFETNSIVYEVPDTDTLYYYDSYRGRARAVPTLDARGDVVSQDVTADQLRDDLPRGLIYGGRVYTPPNPDLSVRTAGGQLNNAEQARLRQDMSLAINGDLSYRDFLERLNSEYDLNSQQFFQVAQIVINRNAGPAISQQDALYTGFYTDEPVYYWTDRGRLRVTQDPQVYIQAFGDREDVRESVERIDRTWRTTNYAVRTQAERTHNSPVSPQTYVITELEEDRLDPELIPPPDFLLERPQNDVGVNPDSNRPNRQFEDPITGDIEDVPTIDEIQRLADEGGLEDLTEQQRQAYNTLLEEAAAGAPQPERIDPALFQEGSGNPPVVAGQQTYPVVAGENVPAPLPQEQVQRYEAYFNSQQGEFRAFRNMFRDLLPLFGGAAGGYFAFSLARSRERGTIQEILNQERLLLDTLDVRVENALERLDNIQNLNIEADQQRTTGYQLLELLNIQRGELAGMEDDPDIDADRLVRDVQLSAGQLAQSNQRLREILNEINEATESLDDLTDELQDATASRIELNSRLDNLMERNRQILTDIYRYNPQIVAGIQIGTTLGLVLSGYFFPTYVDIDDSNEFIKADNINYNPKTPTDKKKEKAPLPNKPKIPFNIMKPEKIQSDLSITNNNNKLRQPIQRNFIPVKTGSRGAHLTYKQIQEYKATLSSQELKNLAGQSLIFGADDYVLKKADRCMSVQKEVIIKQKKVKI